MGANRTISESKDDLKAAADAIPATFRTTFEVEPTEIESRELPLFAVLDGIDDNEIQEITPEEDCYDVRYDFETVMVFDDDCLESTVITGRNAYLTKLFSLRKTAKTYPWRIESMRHFRSHWGNVEGWFVRIRFSRYTIEDFSS